MCEDVCPYLLQDFSNARADLLKGLRRELIFAEVLQHLEVRTSRDMCETMS